MGFNAAPLQRNPHQQHIERLQQGGPRSRSRGGRSNNTNNTASSRIRTASNTSQGSHSHPLRTQRTASPTVNTSRGRSTSRPAPRHPRGRSNTPTSRGGGGGGGGGGGRVRSNSGSRTPGSWPAPPPQERGRTLSKGASGRNRSLSNSSRVSGGGGGGGGNVLPSGCSGIDVYARLRPAFSHEELEGDSMRALSLHEDERSVYVRDRFVEERTMEFTKTFGPDSTQAGVYDGVGRSVVRAALQGKNGTFLAYGQTGTGKTYTAFNYSRPEEGCASENGLMYRCVEDLFSQIHSERDRYHTEVTMQFMQLYNDQLQDLLKGVTDEDANVTDLSATCTSLNQTGVNVYNNSVVTGLSSVFVTNADEVMSIYERGLQNRTVRLTTMNAQSSRSHAVFLLRVDRTERGRGQALGATTLQGRLTIVDLAGSERIKRTKADGLQRAEAQAINRSLACLGNVIHALAESSASDLARRNHIPYRDSKLTRLLQDSLGEHGHACILITFSPALVDITETVSSLAFGQRARLIVNKGATQPRCAVDHKKLSSQQALEMGALREENESLQVEVRALRAQLQRPPQPPQEDLQEEVVQLKKIIDEDETLIEDMQTHIKTIRQSMRQVVAEKDAALQDLAQLRAEFTNMASRERAESAEKVHMTGELITSRSDVEIRSQEVDSLRREIVSLRSRSQSAAVSSPPTSPHFPTEEEAASPKDGAECGGGGDSVSPAPHSPATSQVCGLGMGIAPFRRPLQQLHSNQLQFTDVLH